MKIAAIIPAYNEESAIKNVVEQLIDISKDQVWQLEIIVVNDCSTDNTALIASTLPCKLIHLSNNLGIGGAVQTGCKYAFRNGFDYAVQIDGDGQHPPSFLPLLIKTSAEQQCDVVIGSRFLEKSGFQSTFFRRMGIQYFKFLIQLLCGINITDCTSGFRLMNRKTLELINVYYPDEYPEPESVILFHLNHLHLFEIQVDMRDRLGGKSSINSLHSVYYMLKVTIAIFFTYIRLKKKR